MRQRDFLRKVVMEPNFAINRDMDNYPSLLLRTRHTLTFCGYVGVRSGLPLFGSHEERLQGKIDQLSGGNKEIHGGITFGGRLTPQQYGNHPVGDFIHVDDYWFFGFNTTGPTDLYPADACGSVRDPEGIFRHKTYRDYNYCKQILKRLRELIVRVDMGLIEGWGW